MVRALLFVVFFAAACSQGTLIQGRIEGLREIVDQAERNGAYNCAPRELALAQAHLDFAQTELEQGNPVRAEEHWTVAEPNAHAAFRMSPAARCSPRGVIVSRPGDRDGDGNPDNTDECPDDPEDYDAYEDENGCPDDQDQDGDGLPDARDLCVVDPEDADGYLDGDGCPELDNDVDGLADANDRCANEPEDLDGFSDTDGCPDPDNDADSVTDVDDRCPNEPGPPADQGCPRVYQDVQVTATHIRITQTIHFEFNRAVIRSQSFGILNTVAQVMRDYPDVTVEVQGHTDNRGSDSYNLDLSHRRAGAVRDYLIAQGIPPARLTSQGYGESRPIESNRTNTGRAANRRVEFVRTDAGARQAVP
jgi:outer membrane protein OmpA-like peptidoglycan-associated protein